MESERRLQFLLALRLCQPNPDRMLEEIPWRIWLEWRQFYSEYPFDFSREDYMSAQLAMLMANAWFRKDKSSAVFTVDDFMPKFGSVTPQESDASKAERLLSYVMDVNQLMGGEIVDGNRNQAS